MVMISLLARAGSIVLDRIGIKPLSMNGQGNLTMSNKAAGFLKDVGDEMKKVSWPNKEQLQEATIVTVLVCAIITVFVFIVDQVFSRVMSFIFDIV